MHCVIPAAAVGEIGEPSPFFESSSELPTSFACRSGKPRLKRLAADVDELDGVADDDADAVVVSLALASLVERFPYLFFKYRAHELRAAPSLSVSVLPPLLLTGEVSRDFKACDERLRDRSDPPKDDDVPYL